MTRAWFGYLFTEGLWSKQREQTHICIDKVGCGCGFLYLLKGSRRCLKRRPVEEVTPLTRVDLVTRAVVQDSARAPTPPLLSTPLLHQAGKWRPREKYTNKRLGERSGQGSAALSCTSPTHPPFTFPRWLWGLCLRGSTLAREVSCTLTQWAPTQELTGTSDRCPPWEQLGQATRESALSRRMVSVFCHFTGTTPQTGGRLQADAGGLAGLLLTVSLFLMGASFLFKGSCWLTKFRGSCWENFAWWFVRKVGSGHCNLAVCSPPPSPLLPSLPPLLSPLLFLPVPAVACTGSVSSVATSSWTTSGEALRPSCPTC